MRSWVPVFALVVVIVVGGCLIPGGGSGSADPDSVSERVDQQLDSIETLRTTLVWEAQIDGQRSSFRAKIAYEQPNRINLTYLSPAALEGVHIVGNGSELTVYNADNERFTTRDATGNGSGPAGLFVGLTAVENATFEGNETLAGEDALELSYAVDGSELSLLLSGGTPTTSLSDSGDDAVDVTVWIDRDRWVPRKATLNYSAFREGMNATVTYEDTRINESLAEGTFSVDVPGDAERVDSMMETMLPENATGYTTYDELARDSPDGVPPASLPGNFSFRQGYALSGPNGSLYQLTYRNASAALQFQFVDRNVSILGSTTTRSIAGETVRVTRINEASMLEWHCEGRTYLLIGSTDDLPTARIVTAVGCA